MTDKWRKLSSYCHFADLEVRVSIFGAGAVYGAEVIFESSVENRKGDSQTAFVSQFAQNQGTSLESLGDYSLGARLHSRVEEKAALVLFKRTEKILVCFSSPGSC